MKRCWILLNVFSVSIEMVICFFLPFILLLWCINLMGFQTDHPFTQGVNPTWSWCTINPFTTVGFSLILFVEDFSVNIHEEYWSIFCFLVVSLCGFDIRVILAVYNELGSDPSSVLGKILKRMAVASLNVW